MNDFIAILFQKRTCFIHQIAFCIGNYHTFIALHDIGFDIISGFPCATRSNDQIIVIQTGEPGIITDKLICQDSNLFLFCIFMFTSFIIHRSLDLPIRSLPLHRHKSSCRRPFFRINFGNCSVCMCGQNLTGYLANSH